MFCGVGSRLIFFRFEEMLSMTDILDALLYTFKTLFITTVPMKPTTFSHIKSDQSRGVAINVLVFFWHAVKSDPLGRDTYHRIESWVRRAQGKIRSSGAGLVASCRASFEFEYPDQS
jgi:hypothetical protein